jgi:hypothetical protein
LGIIKRLLRGTNQCADLSDTFARALGIFPSHGSGGGKLVTQGRIQPPYCWRASVVTLGEMLHQRFHLPLQRTDAFTASEVSSCFEIMATGAIESVTDGTQLAARDSNSPMPSDNLAGARAAAAAMAVAAAAAVRQASARLRGATSCPCVAGRTVEGGGGGGGAVAARSLWRRQRRRRWRWL